MTVTMELVATGEEPERGDDLRRIAVWQQYQEYETALAAAQRRLAEQNTGLVAVREVVEPPTWRLAEGQWEY